jgi:hypothetical protein
MYVLVKKTSLLNALCSCTSYANNAQQSQRCPEVFNMHIFNELITY